MLESAVVGRTMKIEVRRRKMADLQFLAKTVDVPSSIAEHLNMEAMAVLAVIRDEAKATGRCTLPLARIAERQHRQGQSASRQLPKQSKETTALVEEMRRSRKWVFGEAYKKISSPWRLIWRTALNPERTSSKRFLLNTLLSWYCGPVGKGILESEEEGMMKFRSIAGSRA
jgi:hypothetical protein